jgi:hypothetical protein
MDKRRKDCGWNYEELRECTYIWTKKANKKEKYRKMVDEREEIWKARAWGIWTKINMSNPKVIWKTLALKPGGNLLKASTLLISFKSCLTLFKLWMQRALSRKM